LIFICVDVECLHGAYTERIMGKRKNFTADVVAGFKCQSGKAQSIYWDGKTPGLGVRVTPSNAKSYIFETRLHSKTIRVTIGSPDVWPLETQWRTDKETGEKVEHQRGARQEAARLKSMTDQGIDPREIQRAKIEAKEAKVTAAAAAKDYTLAKLYEAYCTHLEAGGKKGSARSARSFFNTHTPKALKEKPAKDVSAEEVADMLRTVTEKGKERTAGSLRTYLLAAYNIGIRARLDPLLPIAFKKYGITANPIAPIPAIASRTSNRVLTNGELQAYIRALDGRLTDKALALALLSGGQRMEQILRATVSDWTPETETLRLFDPKGRRKEARTHLLPLAPRAAAIMKSLVADATKAKATQLFDLDVQSPGKRAKLICDTKDNKTGTARIEPACNLRDIRRTVETRMAGLGINKDTRAQVLSHGLSGVQDKHYDRHSYEAEKRNALTAWENWLTAIEKGKKPAPNVVPLKRKTAA
jgi:integrase